MASRVTRLVGSGILSLKPLADEWQVVGPDFGEFWCSISISKCQRKWLGTSGGKIVLAKPHPPMAFIKEPETWVSARGSHVCRAPDESESTSPLPAAGGKWGYGVKSRVHWL